MPPRKAAKRKRNELLSNSREDEASSDVLSEDEQSDDSRTTPPDEEEGEEEEDDDQSDTKTARTTLKGMKRSEMKKWRRLAIEEKEAIVNEGGIVWRAAQPLMSTLPTKAKKEMTALLTSALRNAEANLNNALVPPTIRMPHASRNVGLGAGLASTTSGSIAGSIMSWQVERGERLVEEEGNDEERDEVALLELGGFSSDIALLESLLLPEASETVSMTRAIEEQERELEVSKEQLVRLKEDRESRKREGERTGSEVSNHMLVSQFLSNGTA